VDIRPNVSATSTILTKYIQELDLTLEQEVATALLYGIRAGDAGLQTGHDPGGPDRGGVPLPFADHDTLEQVESPSMSPETLDVPLRPSAIARSRARTSSPTRVHSRP